MSDDDEFSRLALADDVLEACLYILRERLRASWRPGSEGLPG
jgi:hypothetical protein